MVPQRRIIVETRDWEKRIDDASGMNLTYGTPTTVFLVRPARRVTRRDARITSGAQRSPVGQENRPVGLVSCLPAASAVLDDASASSRTAFCREDRRRDRRGTIS